MRPATARWTLPVARPQQHFQRVVLFASAEGALGTRRCSHATADAQVLVLYCSSCAASNYAVETELHAHFVMQFRCRWVKQAAVCILCACTTAYTLLLVPAHVHVLHAVVSAHRTRVHAHRGCFLFSPLGEGGPKNSCPILSSRGSSLEGQAPLSGRRGRVG